MHIMGLEKVKEEVLQKAKERADAILKQGKQEVQQLEAYHTSRLKQERERMEESTHVLVIDMKRQELSQASIDARTMLLKTKKERLESVVEKTLQKLAKMSVDEKRDILVGLLKGSQNDIKIKTVYCNKDDVPIIKKLGNYTIQTADILGGVILENEDGTVRIDLSYESIMGNVVEQNLTKISSILFGTPEQNIPKEAQKTTQPAKTKSSAKKRSKKKKR